MVVLKNISCDDFLAMSGEKKDNPKKPSTASINLDRDVDDALTAFCGETRIKRSVVNGTMRWFLNQSSNVRRIILKDTDAIEDFLLEMLRGMIHEIEEKKNDPHAVRELKAKRARNNE